MEPVERYQGTASSEETYELQRTGSRVSFLLERAKIKDKSLNSKSLLEQYILLRPGFVLDHLDLKSLVVVSRTYVHFMTLVIVNLIVPVNNWLGSAPYLINVLGIWDPPGGFSVFAGILMAFANFLMVCSSFLIFVVVHAICWRIHGYMTPEQVYAVYPECKKGDSLCLTVALLDGKFLNIKSTAVTVFGIFFCLSFHSYLTNYRPYLRFMWLAGMVPIFIMAPEAAHNPLWEPWVWAKSAVQGFGFSCAFKALLCCVWFPHTSSEKIIGQTSTLLNGLRGTAIEMFGSEHGDPTEPNFGDKMSEYSKRIEALLKKTSALALDLVVCRYEITYSRFDWHDLHELTNRAKSLGNLLYNYRFAYIELNDRASESSDTDSGRSFNEAGHTRTQSLDFSADDGWMSRRLGKNYKKAGVFEQSRHQDFLSQEKKLRPIHKPDLQYMFHEITKHYEPLRDACTECVQALEQWFADANTFRVWSALSPSYRAACRERQQYNEQQLLLAMKKISEVYDFISENGQWTSETLIKDGQGLGTRSYIISYALHYGFITKEYARYVRNLAKWCLYLDKTRPEARWMFHPLSSSRRSKFKATELSLEMHTDLDCPDDAVAYEPPSRTQARDPDATPPRNLLHYFFLKFFLFKQAFWNSKVKYAIKVGGTGLIPLIPFFIRTSLKFTHDHRGIWFAIICMISVNSSAADCTFGLISRLAASFFGCVVGIVCWYASDQGNPYGLGAMLAGAGVFIAYFRHFNTVGGLVMNIVLTLTIVLVTMGSYQERVNPTAALSFQQNGAALALERFVTVNLGISLAYIATLLPDFHTTKQSARTSLGRNLSRIGEIQGDLLNFAFQRYDNPHVRRDIFKDVIINKIRAGFHQSRAIGDQLEMLRYEPPLTGYWPKFHYKLFVELEEQLLHMMPLFYTLITRIEDKDSLPILLECMGWTNPELISSFNSVIYMSTAAITRARPLPTLTPGHISADYQVFLDRLFKGDSWQRSGYEIELSKTHDGKLILVGMILAEVFYSRIDGLLLIIKSLVGEYGDTDSRVWEGFV